jgi:hypothetical protein
MGKSTIFIAKSKLRYQKANSGGKNQIAITKVKKP